MEVQDKSPTEKNIVAINKSASSKQPGINLDL
jgi:hypothetical protein